MRITHLLAATALLGGIAAQASLWAEGATPSTVPYAGSGIPLAPAKAAAVMQPSAANAWGGIPTGQ